MTSVYDTVKAVEADLNRILLEREGAVQNALLALLTRQHYLQVSREPGTGKTMLAQAVHARLTGSRYFEVCFNPGTTADELLGPIDMLAYADHGKRVRVMARSFAEADFALLDEIGRGNDLVYPVLLPLMGDSRTVNELGMDSRLTIPLMSVFAASNTHLGDQRLEALNNRFLLRDEIVPVQERDSLIALATKPAAYWHEVRATMSLDALRLAQVEAQTVQSNREVLDAALTLKAQLLTEGVVVTGRMWKWSFPLIKAHAWLHGSDTMTLEDLSALASAWWCDPKDRKGVQRAIYAVANPLEQRALEMEDDCMDLLTHLPDPKDPEYKQAGEDLNVTLGDKIKALDREIKTSCARDKRKAMASLQRIWNTQKQHAANYSKHTALGRVEIDLPSALVA